MQPLLPSDPTQIGRYELRGRLGTGGMGTVYLGHSPGGRLAAVKVIKAQVLAQPDALARFRREAETLRTVRSAYTAALIDCELTAPPYWMATEFIPGPTLADVLAAEGPMSVDTCLLLTASLAEGLSDIHAHGICHRDLKPQNVILSPSGPHLIDFGLARDPADTGLTQTDIIVGTLGYVAPELLTSDDGLNPATDVFALGATIAHAATGRRPYGTGRAESLCYRILHEDIDLEGVDFALEQLIRSCVAREPAQRPLPAEIIEYCRRSRREQTTAGVPGPGPQPARTPPSWSVASTDASPSGAAPVRTPPIWPVPPSSPPAEPSPADRPGRVRKRLLLVVAAVAAAIVLVAGGAVAALRLSPAADPRPVTPVALGSPSVSPSATAASSAPAPAKTPPSRKPSPTAKATATSPSRKPASPSATPPPVTTVTSADGRCIEMPQTDANGAQVKAGKCNGSAGQRWRFTQQGALMPATATAARCLDIGGNEGSDIGYRIQLWDCSFNGAQRWVPQTDGSLFNAVSGRCLSILPDDDGGPALAILTCTAKASQRWKLPE